MSEKHSTDHRHHMQSLLSRESLLDKDARPP